MLTYHYHPAPESYREDYQVWLLSKDDFDNICTINANDWKEDWGWWRHCPGSNMESPLNEYIIRGQKIVAWDGIKRELYFQTCLKCPDYYRHCGEHHSPNNACFASYEEQASVLAHVNIRISSITSTTKLVLLQRRIFALFQFI